VLSYGPTIFDSSFSFKDFPLHTHQTHVLSNETLHIWSLIEARPPLPVSLSLTLCHPVSLSNRGARSTLRTHKQKLFDAPRLKTITKNPLYLSTCSINTL